MFIEQNGEVFPGFLVGGFFLGGRGGCTISADFWAIHPSVCGDSAFPGDFLAGELGENFVFWAVVVTIFFFIIYLCIYSYIVIIIIIIILVGVN